MCIYQDLVEQFGLTYQYNILKRFVRGLKEKAPISITLWQFLPGEESQVDDGSGAPTPYENGKDLKP